MKHRSNSMTIKLSTSQLRDAAMRSSGIDPTLLAIKPGTRRHDTNRKSQLARGQVKHKGQLWH